jgi:hypothetical protein
MTCKKAAAYIWLVVINHIPYETEAKTPWEALEWVLKEHCKGKEPSILYDISLVNKTLKDQRDGKTGGE